MFCPGCGAEDNQSNQFCRVCGSDLRVVRTALLRPDSVTASASAAREEIGRAFADRIRSADRKVDLSAVAEEVLPQIEKFLESPEERRLRRMRQGSVTAAIGLGTTVAVIGAAILFRLSQDNIALVQIFSILGVITFFIGLGLMINGIFLSRTTRHLPDAEFGNDGLNSRGHKAAPPTSDLKLQEAKPESFISVTEPTTRHLEESRLKGK